MFSLHRSIHGILHVTTSRRKNIKRKRKEYQEKGRKRKKKVRREE
jgi:hypothetical protein